MSVRDIIAAATPGPWQNCGGVVFGNKYGTCDCGCDAVADCGLASNVDFIATFNPAHVALMEAVVFGLDNYGCTVDFWEGCPICGSAGLTTRPDAGLVDGFKHDADCPYVALHALNIYRTERGPS